MIRITYHIHIGCNSLGCSVAVEFFENVGIYQNTSFADKKNKIFSIGSSAPSPLPGEILHL